MNQAAAPAAFTALLIGLIIAAIVTIINRKAGGAVLLLTLAVFGATLFLPPNPLTQMLQQYLGS